jgi:hypothetical protein
MKITLSDLISLFIILLVIGLGLGYYGLTGKYPWPEWRPEGTPSHSSGGTEHGS